MGLYDRDYTQEHFRSSYRSAPQMRVGFPKPSTVVGKLILINVVVFMVSFIITPLGRFIYTWFSVFPVSWSAFLLQPWRILTYQFLHAGFWHIFGNMLILYFLGPSLERLWGSKKFLIFYLTCGATGGILYPLLFFVGWLHLGSMIGASGAVLGVIAAAAILFPNALVYIWGILPVRLFVLALILAAVSIMTLLRPAQFENAGGEAAHLAGMVAGAVYVFWPSIRTKLRFKTQGQKWQRKVARQRDFEMEVDRILKKVHDSGIHSLTAREKRILKKATRDQQMQTRL